MFCFLLNSAWGLCWPCCQFLRFGATQINSCYCDNHSTHRCMGQASDAYQCIVLRVLQVPCRLPVFSKIIPTASGHRRDKPNSCISVCSFLALATQCLITTQKSKEFRLSVYTSFSQYLIHSLSQSQRRSWWMLVEWANDKKKETIHCEFFFQFLFLFLSFF